MHVQQPVPSLFYSREAHRSPSFSYCETAADRIKILLPRFQMATLRGDLLSLSPSRLAIDAEHSRSNGPVDVDEVLHMLVKELGTSIEPYILRRTPEVLSVGMRCMHHGVHG